MSLFDILSALPAQVDFGGGAPMPAMATPPVDIPQPAIAQSAAPQGHHGLLGFLGGGEGIGNVLGSLGDALLVSNGMQPMYAPRQRAKKIGAALANYLGNMEPGMADIFQSDPSTGLELYKMKHPASETPANVREFQYAQQNGYKGSYADWVKLTHPGFMAPITLGPGDTYDAGGGDPSGGGHEVTATGPNGEKVRLNPQTNQWEPMGGQTPQASGPFPGQ